MKLSLEVEGASEADIQRGIAAAEAASLSEPLCADRARG